MTKLVLIRGLPGSGKSTLAKSLCLDRHYEADMWFSTDKGYVFKPQELKQAHEWCLNSTKEALQLGLNVVVSNTFTQKWEMQPYIDLGFPVEVITATGNFKNVHGVPDAAIKRMRERWEN